MLIHSSRVDEASEVNGSTIDENAIKSQEYYFFKQKYFYLEGKLLEEVKHIISNIKKIILNIRYVDDIISFR